MTLIKLLPMQNSQKKEKLPQVDNKGNSLKEEIVEAKIKLPDLTKETLTEQMMIILGPLICNCLIVLQIKLLSAMMKEILM